MDARERRAHRAPDPGRAARAARGLGAHVLLGAARAQRRARARARGGGAGVAAFARRRPGARPLWREHPDIHALRRHRIKPSRPVAVSLRQCLAMSSRGLDIARQAPEEGAGALHGPRRAPVQPLVQRGREPAARFARERVLDAELVEDRDDRFAQALAVVAGGGRELLEEDVEPAFDVAAVERGERLRDAAAGRRWGLRARSGLAGRRRGSCRWRCPGARARASWSPAR